MLVWTIWKIFHSLLQYFKNVRNASCTTGLYEVIKTSSASSRRGDPWHRHHSASRRETSSLFCDETSSYLNCSEKKKILNSRGVFMNYGHFTRFFRTIEIEIIMKNSEEEEAHHHQLLYKIFLIMSLLDNESNFIDYTSKNSKQPLVHSTNIIFVIAQ